MKANVKRNKRIRRHKKVVKRITVVVSRPRLAVFRSNKHIYAQVIDDSSQTTLACASDTDKEVTTGKKTKVEIAKEVGVLVAKRAVAKKVTNVAFDRGGFMFKGRVKALAEGGREGGLTF